MVKCYRKIAVTDLWVSSHDKLGDFYASSWQHGDSPLPLLVVRAMLALLAVAILAWSVCEAPNLYWLLYLTNWGLVLVTAMLISGLGVSCMAASKRLPEEGDLPWYVCTYWFLYNVSVTLALVITALYWLLLFDSESAKELGERMFWLDVATHGANSCLALAEVVAARTPVRLLHVYQPLGAGLWYAAFTAVYYATGGKDGNGNPFIYEVLDWRQGRRTGTVVGLSAVGLLAIYAALWCVAFGRDKLSASLLRTSSIKLEPAPADYMNAGFA